VIVRKKLPPSPFLFVPSSSSRVFFSRDRRDTSSARYSALLPVAKVVQLFLSLALRSKLSGAIAHPARGRRDAFPFSAADVRLFPADPDRRRTALFPSPFLFLRRRVPPFPKYFLREGPRHFFFCAFPFPFSSRSRLRLVRRDGFAFFPFLCRAAQLTHGPCGSFMARLAHSDGG